MHMRAIPVLRTNDANSTCVWFSRFGFSEDWRWQSEMCGPITVSVSCAGGATLYISEGRAKDMDSTSPTEVYLIVAEIETVSKEVGLAPELMPWGDQEIRVQMPDGNFVTFSQPASD